MKQALAFVIATFFASSLVADEASKATFTSLVLPMETSDLTKFLWKNRLVVIFAESENDPSFIEQMRLLSERPEALATRDILIVADTNSAAKSALRDRFRPRGFMMVLIGKDGQVYLRKPLPWNVREITRSVDKLPLRQQEVRDRR